MQPLIARYVDGELDRVRSFEIEHHVEACAVCTPVYQETLDLRSAIREGASYFSAPRKLKQRIRVIVREQAEQERRVVVLPWHWIGMAAALAFVLLFGVWIQRVTPDSSHKQFVAQEIIAGHIRSLMVNHLTDVNSSDYHMVKPWFEGKLDFAPPVEDLGGDGFPLVGCRLDYADGRPIAALVYQRRLHYINVFVWPSKDIESNKVTHETREGYNLVHWSQAGMTFWAVSDLANNEMQMLVNLLRK
jgi:anti-sigma factor RsiW